MINSLLDHRADSVREALLGFAESAEPEGAGKFKVIFGELPGLPFSVTLEDEWICFDGLLNGRAPDMRTGESVWKVLESNSGLGGGVRFALRPSTQFLSLRADVLVGEDNVYPARIREICRAVPKAAAAAGARSGVGKGMPGQRRAGAETPHVPESCLDLAALCRDAGWDFEQRATGLAVSLDVPGGFYRAFLSNGRGVRASVSLPRCEDVTDGSRLAIGILMLTAGWLMRMARPIADGNADSGCANAAFEVAFGSDPTPDELDAALKALSVACRLCAQEVMELRDADVADVYLSVRGWD